MSAATTLDREHGDAADDPATEQMNLFFWLMSDPSTGAALAQALAFALQLLKWFMLIVLLFVVLLIMLDMAKLGKGFWGSDDERFAAELAAAEKTHGDSWSYNVWMLIDNGGRLAKLLSREEVYSNLPSVRRLAHELHVFCHRKLNRFHVRDALKPLVRLLQHSDAGVLSEACRTLSLLADGPCGWEYEADARARVQLVARNPSVCRRLAELVGHPSPGVKSYVSRMQSWISTRAHLFVDRKLTGNSTPCSLRPALLTLGNITAGTDAQMQAILDHSDLLLPDLAAILLDPTSCKDFRENACAILANLASGNVHQIQTVVSSNDVLPALLDRLANDDSLDVRKEAAKAVRNVTCHGTALQVMTWTRRGLARSLCTALDSVDATTVSLVLESLENTLCRGDDLAHSDNANDFAGVVPLVMRVLKTDGLSKIRALNRFDDEGVRKRSIQILGMYSWYEGTLDAGGWHEGEAPCRRRSRSAGARLGIQPGP